MDNLVKNPVFLGEKDNVYGWVFCSPRPELSPGYSIVDSDGIRRLGIVSRGDRYAFGCWKGTACLKQGEWYRASVRVRLSDISDPDVSVAAHFAGHFLVTTGRWQKDNILEQVFRYEDTDEKGNIELYLRCAAKGSVEWSDPVVERIEKPKHRMARIATIRFGEPGHGVIPDMDHQAERIRMKLELAGAIRPDLVLLPEFSQIIGVDKEIYGTYFEAAQAVPNGSLCSLLKEEAKKHGMYVVAGMIEKRGSYMFNTAVIFDREGRFAGQYDKTHLTFSEMTEGFSCGDAYPVFDLDFGRIGIHICYDEWFPEVARYYAHRGIQILLLPVAGGKPITWRTRAIDNGIYFVTASINPPSMIIGSSGEILAQTHADGIVFADLDLDYRETNWYRDPTLVSGMPCIIRQMRNTMDNSLLKDIYNSEDQYSG